MRAQVVVRAPGRVNLIGEHTDHQEGFVLPMAVGLATTLRARARGDGVVRLASAAAAGTVEFGRTDDPAAVEPAWGRYPAAVVALLRRAGLPVFGFDGEISGDLPVGAGLSSSAALDVAVALAAIGIARENDARIPPPLTDLSAVAALCRDAEALGAGVNCGIMDPFACLHGRAGAALLLDCRTLEWRPVPVRPDEVAFVVAESGVRHALAAGGYRRRRAECDEAARRIGVRILRDATAAAVARAGAKLGPLLHRRARHVVTENARVAEAAEALDAGDVETFGALLDASHASLRDDFEVSCPEVDTLADLARAAPGALGARMTGGGFGGSVVLAVRPESLREALAHVSAEGARALGRDVRARVVLPSDGARAERVA